MPNTKAYSVAKSGMTLVATLSPSAVSEVNADGIFTTAYENYLIEIVVDQSANSVLFGQLRSGGSTLTTTTYTWDTTAGAAASGQVNWELAANTGGACSIAMAFTIYRPQLAQATLGINDRIATLDNVRTSYGYTNSNASAYDGLKIYGTSGTITGKIRVYGLAN